MDVWKQSLDPPALAREEFEALHDEIARLPGAFRLPVVLCYFEGLTLDEAASHLRWPAGTVRSRLARARDKLRRGLTRRGVVMSGAALITALGDRFATASVSSLLCDNTTRAAIHFTTGQAATPLAVSLAQEVIRAMLMTKLRLMATTLVLFALVATGVGYFPRFLAMKDEPRSQPHVTTVIPDDAAPRPATGRMFVVGRVLDSQGKPVPDAKVMVQARVKYSDSPVGFEGWSPIVIGHVDADQSGRFRLDAPRTSSWRNDEFLAVALAPGYGVGWSEVDTDADQPDTEIRLNPEQLVQGLLFDLRGRPAQGVTVSVSMMRRILIGDAANPYFLRRRSEGPLYRWSRVNDLPAWPKPAISDADGRFALHGVGHGLRINFSIIDPRFALHTFEIEPDRSTDTKPLTLALRPAQILTGRVTYADTGKPVPHASLVVRASSDGQRGGRSTDFPTDADGRFRANPSPGDEFEVRASAPAGQLYLAASKKFEWPKGAVEHSLDLSLPRGVLVRGKVTEKGSGRPVAGALVVFVSHRVANDTSDGGGQVLTLADGSFKLATASRHGHLAILGSAPDYLLQEIGNRELSLGEPGGSRLYSHAFIACDPKPGSGLEVNVSLGRCVTVTGQILEPDDQPVPDTWIISRIALRSSPTAWNAWRGNYHGNAHQGRFEVHGLDPDSVTDVPVHFLEPNRKLGATVHLSGKSAGDEPITVRLQPCGAARARLVDTTGQPVADYHDQYMISMTVTPGADRASRDPADAKRLVADQAYLTVIDSINYLKEPASDAEGRIVFPALIPGATYRISTSTRASQASDQPLSKEFTVKPGETLDLGDIIMERRPS